MMAGAAMPHMVAAAVDAINTMYSLMLPLHGRTMSTTWYTGSIPKID